MMRKDNSHARCSDIHMKSFSRGKILAVLLAVMLLADMSSAYAADILEGTPTTYPGYTIYKADVFPGETYSSIYGLRGNSDSTYCGLVNVNEGTVTGTIYGCRALSGDELTKSSYNTVNLLNSTAGTVYGGYAYGGSQNASVHQNKVNITGGSVSLYVYGGNADGSTLSVTGNSVNIKNANIGKTVYGGCAFNTSSWLSMLRNNVVIDNSTVNGSIYGGYASGSSTASNSNTVTIKGDSVIKGSVHGGYALSSNSDAKNNTVIILGGTLNNHIYGGIGRNATGNTIVLKGGNLINADLYGYSDGRKSHASNSLEVWEPEITIRSAQNFESYYFIVPDGVANTDKFMLKTQTPIRLSGTTVGVAVQNGTAVSVNDRINLIDKIESVATEELLVGKELKGGTLFLPCEFLLTIENGTLVARITEIYPPNMLRLGNPLEESTPQATGLIGGQIASLVLLGEGNDLAMDMALSDAETAANTAQDNGEDLAAFLTLGGEKSQYYTSAHINLLSVDLIIGVSKKISSDMIDSLFGFYFETGNGDYSTFSSTDGGAVFGEGISQYYGGGIMIQTNLLENRALYLQTIGRIGSLDNNWNSDSFSEKVVYNTNHLYFGASLGAGYQGDIGKGFGYDAFGRFMWTHQNGSDADINGEQLAFNGIDLLKTRLGARIDYTATKLEAFLGLAWERQFNQKAAATINGTYPVKASVLVGNTGLLELGVSYRPQDNWRFDLTATGYLGFHKGITGSAFVSLSF